VSTLKRSNEILEYLDRANLFLVPLDDERQWYRYHHLFSDLLRTQLQKSLGEQGVTQLHLRAADWYEQHGSILDAIYHASLASDFERIERLIEQNYMAMMNQGENASIRFWMGKLSKEKVCVSSWRRADPCSCCSLNGWRMPDPVCYETTLSTYSPNSRLNHMGLQKRKKKPLGAEIPRQARDRLLSSH
jgi:hypothetical protein